MVLLVPVVPLAARRTSHAAPRTSHVARRTSHVLFAAVLAGASVAAAQQQPRFQAGVELLRVSVSVTDERGTPIRDLGPQDFTVYIDGKPRTVRFAQRYEPELATAAAPDASASLPSYALNTSSPAGRVIVLAVDLFALKQGYEKLVLDAAARLVDTLGPNEAVGLMPIPGKGVDLTRDHRLVSDALRTLRGTTNVPFIRHYFTIREAVAFEQRERRIVSEVIERECSEKDYTCPTELRDETHELLRFARQHVSTVLTNVSRLAEALQAIDAPKTIVLISAGMPFEMETLTYFTELQRAVAKSGTIIQSVQVDQPVNDASNLRRPGVGTYQPNDIQTGLANAATLSGGTLFPAVGAAEGVFDRLRSEVSYSYELGIDAAPSDADGKAHGVKVSVARPGVTVRGRREIILAPLPDRGTRLGALLAQPVDRAELPIGLAAYTVRGDAADTLKLIINSEIGDRMPGDSRVQYALVITKGAAVAFQTNGTAQPEAGVARALLAAQLAPGRYRVRLAALDDAGRGGTVELPLSVGLRAVGSLQASDLLVGTSQEQFKPAVQLSAEQSINALVELYSTDAERFASVSVRFEVSRGGAVVADAAARPQPTESDGRQVAGATLETTHLLPGEYVVSAVVSEQGKAVGRISRRVRIAP